MDRTSSVMRTIRKITDDMLEAEKYGGTSVLSVLDAVDIAIGFGMDNQGRPTTLQVVEHDCTTLCEHSVPGIRNIYIHDGRYMILRPEINDFDWVTEDSVKVMRARFLLIRNYYYPLLNSLSPQSRGEAVANFFGGSVWTPKPGTAIAKALGCEPRT